MIIQNTQKIKPTYISKYDLLDEILKSKISFCWIYDKKYIEYDYFIDDISLINDDFIQLCKVKRAERLTHILLRKLAKERKISYKSILKEKEKHTINPSTIILEDIVIRHRTNEHIPSEINKSGKELKVRTNFPPFKHYAFIDGKLTEVVRSHWKGDLTTGCFSTRHGRVTNKLGQMIMILSEKFSLHHKFRGYSYRDEFVGEATVHLCANCLKFDETMAEIPNPHAFLTKISENQFKIILNQEKKQRDIRDDLIEINGLTPSLTRQQTANDDIITADYYNETAQNIKHNRSVDEEDNYNEIV